MTDSILDETKQKLGIPTVDTAFDIDIITSINSAFMVLNQVGVGPQYPFVVVDKNTLWTDFMTDINRFQGVKDYIYLSVRLVFDPPNTSFVIDSIRRQKEELEWRLPVQVQIINDIV